VALGGAVTKPCCPMMLLTGWLSMTASLRSRGRHGGGTRNEPRAAVCGLLRDASRHHVDNANGDGGIGR
jgi:hypothetical protein